MNPLDIVIPVYNEEPEVVVETVKSIQEVFQGKDHISIIVVNDGSDPSFKLDCLKNLEGIRYVEHEKNQGYGRALKTGILTGDANWIAITDADGTYPLEELPRLYAAMEGHDMVIGTRTGSVRQIPWLRRFPKSVLNWLASYMAGTRIRDLNSGMRIFSRDLAYYLWDFFPKGFSFTSTITMGSIMGGFRIKETPINYYKRAGQSSIHPIKDTIRFFRLVCRLGLIFHPVRIFTPVAFVLFVVGAIKGFGFDYRLGGHIGNLSIMSMLSAVQIFMMGLIGKLIVHGRFLRYQRPIQELRAGGSARQSDDVELVHLEQQQNFYDAAGSK